VATITASAAGGAWNTGGAWVGGVAPTAADDALLTSASGNISLPTATTVACRSLDCTGYTGTLTFATTTALLEIGDASGGACKFVPGMTVALTGLGRITFKATTASTVYDFTTAGKNMPSITINTGSTTTIRLADNLSMNGSSFSLTSGTLDLNGKAVVIGSGAVFNSSNSNVRTLTMGASTVTLMATAGTLWNCASSTNLTINPGTSNIIFAGVGSGARSFAGGVAKTYNDLTYTVAGSTGSLTLTQSATFNNLNFSDASNARTLLFTAGTTTTITGAFNVQGSAGKLMTIGSVTAANHTLAKASGTVSSDYLSISRSTAGGGAAWYAGANSTDGGNNTGWIFTAPPSGFNARNASAFLAFV
jgi:hypothetical protein